MTTSSFMSNIKDGIILSSTELNAFGFKVTLFIRRNKLNNII